MFEAVSAKALSEFPVMIDLSAIPAKPEEPTPEAPFTFPLPVVLTGPRSSIRIVKARRRLVAIDSDLAELYGTTVDAVNKAAMRNACCLPRSACFRLSNTEWHQLKNDVLGGAGLAEADRGDWLCAPLAFTEEGAEALARILGTFDAVRGYVIAWSRIRKLTRSMERTMA